MTTSYFPGNLQWLGIAKETTYGTAPASPAAFVPLVSPKLTPHVTTLMDDALRGSMAKDYQAQQGMQYWEMSYTSYPYLDSVYQHVLAALGNPDAVTGSADPYTHKTSLLNASQPPSYTLWYADGSGNCKRITGCRSSNLKFSAKADALASFDAGWFGLAATDVTPPSNTPTTNPPMPSWTAVISVGGTALQKYSQLDVTIKRDTTAIAVLNGTQAPGSIFAGVLEVTGDLTGIYQGSADNDLTALIANTQPSLTVKLSPAGDSTHYLLLQMTKVAYTDVSFDANKYVQVVSKVTALGNTTDALDSNYSPIQAQFLTSASTAY